MINKNIRIKLSVIVVSSLILISLTSCIFSNEKSEKITADDWVDKASKQYDKGDYASAVLSFGNAIKLDSTTSIAYPGLMKSIIKRDSLVEKYFDIDVTADDFSDAAFISASTDEQNMVYQTLIYLNSVKTIYLNKAQEKIFGEDYSISFIVHDVTLMYTIARYYDYNFDSVIDEKDVLVIE